MDKKEFLIGIKYLSEAYGKDFTKDETTIWYDFLNPYTFHTFQRAIRKMVGKHKYIPKIADMIDYIEQVEETNKFEILDKMKKGGYFKNNVEFDKAVSFLESGIIPKWFKEDMERFSNKSIGNVERKMLGG